MITGVQESLTRDEIKSLIEQYGGKVTTSVSSRTTYLITGTEAGESKLKKVKLESFYSFIDKSEDHNISAKPFETYSFGIKVKKC